MTQMGEARQQKSLEILRLLYDEATALEVAHRLHIRLSELQIVPRPPEFHQRTAVAIAYGDHVRKPGEAPLRTLREFLKDTYGDHLSHLHILPFFPYSSDDGFSVIDYMTVDPKLGSWNDTELIETDFGMMFDFVLNHISSQSEWFQKFLKDDPEYRDFFITLTPDTDVSLVRRPRTHPLLTPFETASGVKHVWTTFSTDQIDLNYANPEVLLRMIDVLLLYVQRGAHIIRMDAITYLWKKVGTECVHLPETHAVAQLFRLILEEVAPHAKIITETNVPHEENISYFGMGDNEAHGVYNFALPPLLIHTLHTANSTKFNLWAKSLQLPSDSTFFFNFTSSHDGIGVTPVKSLLSADEIAAMIERIDQAGGLVSYKTTASGTLEPYEINTTYYDALKHSNDSPELSLNRFLLSQAVMMAMQGVPGIYFGNLIGNQNWTEGPEELGYNRAINRQKMILGEHLTVEDLNDSTSFRGKVAASYRQLLSMRGNEPDFAPHVDMRVHHRDPRLITIERGDSVVTFHNVSDQAVEINLEYSGIDLHSGERCAETITLQGYQYRWIKKEEKV